MKVTKVTEVKGEIWKMEDEDWSLHMVEGIMNE